MNRRRRLEKPLTLRLRLLGGRANRRVRPSLEIQPRRVGEELARLGRGLARCGLYALQGIALLGFLGGVGWSGYHAYKKVMASTYFSVKQVQVQGNQRTSGEEILRLVQGNAGKNIFRVDLPAMERAVQNHPWVKAALVRRELPDQLVVEIQEQKPAALLLLGHLYLVDDQGQVFKRATPAETEGLTVITGLQRAQYLNEPGAAQARVQEALAFLQTYRKARRPSLSEIHLGEQGEVSLFLREGGVAVRLGDKPQEQRLQRFDRVWAALGSDARRARVFFLDNEVRADRVTVRLGSSR